MNEMLVFSCATAISQGNFEFGISRIIKSLEPYEKKLGTDTWFYAKRCFLALAEQVGVTVYALLLTLIWC